MGSSPGTLTKERFPAGTDGERLRCDSNVGKGIKWGGGVKSITDADSPYQMLSADEVVLADASGGAITVNLPAVATAADEIHYVKKTDSSGNAVTVAGGT